MTQLGIFWLSYLGFLAFVVLAMAVDAQLVAPAPLFMLAMLLAARKLERRP